jgi:integrase
MNFTDSKIKALKPKKQRYEVWEQNGKGFGVRVSPAGRKSWVYRYRNNDRHARMTLGSYPAMSLADAHAVHSQARLDLEKGVDPGFKSSDARRNERLSPSIKTLCLEYLEKWSKARKKSWKEDERIMRKDIIPILGQRKAKSITRREIVLLLDDIVERGAPVVANRTSALLSSIFNFGIRSGVLESNPCQLVGQRYKETPRDRILSEEEIRLLWSAIDDPENGFQISEASRLATKLLLLTAQRRGEVALSKWSEFDLDSGWWTIPAERAKNGFAHRVPLTNTAIEVLGRLKELSGESEWVFPSPRDKNKPASVRSINRAISCVCEGQTTKDGDSYTTHDLRRTAASHMAKAGIPRLVVKKVLNHVDSDITAIYDRHSYDDEKCQALETWKRDLLLITTGKNQN